MKKLEMILIIGAIIGILMALLNHPLDSLIVSVFLQHLDVSISILALHC